MAGNFHGRVDCLTNASNVSATYQEVFVNMYQFYQNLASSSYAQLIAMYTGSNATGQPAGGNGGTNFHNEPNPFGENAFACFRIPSGSAPDGSVSARAVDYYVLFTWCYNNVIGTGNASPLVVYGSDTLELVAMSIAWRDDGTSPWNGTTFSTASATKHFGEDSVGTPVWTPGTSSLRSFPRSNDSGGSYSTNRNNTLGLTYQNLSVNTPYRYHFIGDRDSVFFTIDFSDNNSYDSYVMWGVWDPMGGITTGPGGTAPMPMYQFSDYSNAFIAPGNTYGDTGGTSEFQGGMVGVPSAMTVPVVGVRNDRYTTNIFVNSTNTEPNKMFVSASLDLFTIPIIAYEAPNYGLVGFADTFQETFNTNVNAVNSGSTLAVFGSAPSNNHPQFVVPWNSGSSPGTSTTRTGVTF